MKVKRLLGIPDVKPFIPVKGVLQHNRILNDLTRMMYSPVIEQMYDITPKMMKRKIPEANVQQAFVMNTVYTTSERIANPKILCVGSFEDTACECLKAIGFKVDEVDPAINYDLDTFMERSTTFCSSYDIIFSTSVIEHVYDDVLFIVEIAMLLKPGGLAIMTCDFNNRYKPGDKLPTTDIRFYTEESLNNLMKYIPDCSLVDEPIWGIGEPDFIYEGINYSFATLVFRKN
jgi:hypothetical protein